MIRTMTIAILLMGGSATIAAAQTDAPVQPPPANAQMNNARTGNAQADQDMNCRRQAAAAAGYTGSDNGPPSADVQQHYAAAYYGCMSNGAPPNGAPPPGYAYGPPPPAPGYAYGPPPPPYYYGPYPYPYYYPPYYGPAVTFGFGFGGRYGGRWR
jgi:hypothetical protein